MAKWRYSKLQKKNNCHTFKIRNSRALGGTSRVVLELKPFGISIRGLIGSEPWVGRSNGKMSRNSSVHGGGGQCKFDIFSWGSKIWRLFKTCWLELWHASPVSGNVGRFRRKARHLQPGAKWKRILLICPDPDRKRLFCYSVCNGTSFTAFRRVGKPECMLNQCPTSELSISLNCTL